MCDHMIFKTLYFKIERSKKLNTKDWYSYIPRLLKSWDQLILFDFSIILESFEN